MRRSLSRGLVALAVLAGAISACGVPTESTARSIPTDEEVPPVTAPVTAAAPGPSASTVELYFLDGERLELVERPVEQVPDQQVAIDQLLAGVTEEERAEGLVSSIPPDTSVLDLTVEGNLLILNLSEQFALVNENFVRACAQIVFTVTAVGEVTTVRFLVDGSPINPPTVDDGNLAEVSRRHYAALAP